MAQWLNERLDEIQKWLLTILPVSEEILGMFREHFQTNLFDFISDKDDSLELAEARHGNIEPLRKRYPKIAEYIHLPKQPGKGKRFQKSRWQVWEEIFMDPGKNKMTKAAWDVATIRDLWERHYGKKKRSNQPPGTSTSGCRHLSAEDFAAERYKVEVGELCEWMRSRQLPKDLFREKKRNFIFGLI